MNIKKAIIPIAGKGTRFLPATKEVPKEMLPILNRPMIEYVIDEIAASELEEVIFITDGKRGITENYYRPNHELEKFLEDNGKEELKKKIEAIPQRVHFQSVIQSEQLGLGHAIFQAKPCIKEGEFFAVLLPDEITTVAERDRSVISQLIEIAKLHQSHVVGVMEVAPETVHRYGVIAYREKLQDRLYQMSNMVEKPDREQAPSFLATPGRYIFHSSLFDALGRIPRGAGGEFQLTDAISMIAKDKKSSHQVIAYQFAGKRYDTGNLEGYLQATVDFALADQKLKASFMEYLSEVLPGCC